MPFLQRQARDLLCAPAHPGDVLDACPHRQCEVTRGLCTSDLGVAKTRLHAELTRIEAQFEERRGRLKQRWSSVAQSRQQMPAMSEQQMSELVDCDVHFVLDSNEVRRTQGLDDDEFEELGSWLTQ